MICKKLQYNGVSEEDIRVKAVYCKETDLRSKCIKHSNCPLIHGKPIIHVFDTHVENSNIGMPVIQTENLIFLLVFGSAITADFLHCK